MTLGDTRLQAVGGVSTRHPPGGRLYSFDEVRDTVVIELNRRAMAQLSCPTRLEIVPGATHLFEEPGTLDQVVSLATAWFTQYLKKSPGQ